MKKIITLLIAAIITVGSGVSAYAQDVLGGIKHNVLVNGDAKEFTADEAITVGDFSMFTIECYTNKFGCQSLTAERIASVARPFNYAGEQYYRLRDVAMGCGLMIFWDSATSTALVVDKDIYGQIKALMEMSNANSRDAKRIDMEMNGMIDIAINMSGASQNIGADFDAVIKVDFDVPYMGFEAKVSMVELGIDAIEVKVFDDGENTYVIQDGQAIKQKSSLGMSKDLISQIDEIDSAKNDLAENLSYAGLKLTETADGFVLEGDTYIAEMFKVLDLNALVGDFNKLAETEGYDISLEFDWPDTMYVKYVMDKDGNIKEMQINFEMGMNITVDGQSADFHLNPKIYIPKYEINGEFSTVVPKVIVDSAVDY